MSGAFCLTGMGPGCWWGARLRKDAEPGLMLFNHFGATPDFGPGTWFRRCSCQPISWIDRLLQLEKIRARELRYSVVSSIFPKIVYKVGRCIGVDLVQVAQAQAVAQLHL